MGASTLPYRISISRLLLLTVLSYGVYLYYWFYLTWRQYRDHTGNRVFPAWHTLALGVPIYGLFRTHHHVASYNRLMLHAGLRDLINPMLVVCLVLVYIVLSLIAAALYFFSISLSGGLSGAEPPGTVATVTKIGIEILTIIAAAGLIAYVQPKLNGYWESLPEVSVTNGKLGSGEIICLVIGILVWASATLSLVLAK